MERLLKDAQALTGVKYDINNLADVYSAIHAIQEELGITGTTAKEAEKTITGSANMMKAAWQNVLSAIAGGGDLDRAINNLVYSIQKYFENIVPVVERSLVGIGRLIEQVAPLLVQNVASALIQSIPSLINAIYQMIIGLAKGIWQGIKALFTGGSGSVTADIKTSVGGISSSLDSATNSMNGLGDATDAAGKSAKKAGKEAKKTLAAFDDLNIISENSSAGGGGGGGAGGVSGGIGSPTAESVMDIQTEETDEQASWLTQKLAEIAEMVNKIWNSEPIQAYVAAAQTTLGTLWTFITTMWGDIQRNANMTWQNIQGNVQTAGRNLVTLWTQYWSDFNTAVQTWGQPIINSISKLFNSIWSTAIDPAIQLITQYWADFTGILLDLWNEHGERLLNNIGEFVYTTIGLFQSIYDNILEPIITPFLETLSWLWEKHLSKMVYALGDFIMSLVNGALEIYNKFIEPLVEYLLLSIVIGV